MSRQDNIPSPTGGLSRADCDPPENSPSTMTPDEPLQCCGSLTERHEEWCAVKAALDSLDKHKPPSDMTDAELNAAIAVEVMGYRLCHCDHWQQMECVQTDCHPASALFVYSTDIAAAINDVVEKMRKRGYAISLSMERDGRNIVAMMADTLMAHPFASQNRCLPRAICEASLSAVRNEA